MASAVISTGARSLFALGVAALLAGCGSKEPDQPMSCPTVLLLNHANHFTQFRPGGGRDITDIKAEGEITGYKGACIRGKDGLDVTISVSFEVERGPAAKEAEAAFSYFVAVPAFYPDPKAKAVLPVRVAFPAGAAMVRLADEEVTLSLPVQPGERVGKYEIFLGFQLDDDQLNYNRQRGR